MGGHLYSDDKSGPRTASRSSPSVIHTQRCLQGASPANVAVSSASQGSAVPLCDGVGVALDGRPDSCEVVAYREELAQLVALPDARSDRGHRRTRTEQALAMTLAKVSRTADARKEELLKQKGNARLMLVRIARELPTVGRIYGISTRLAHDVDPIGAAEIRVALALGPKSRGQGLQRAAQQRAVTIFSHTCLQLQSQRARSLLALPDIAPEPAPLPKPEPVTKVPILKTFVVKSLVWCWDESEQKVQRFRTRGMSKLLSTAAVSSQILVQAGLMSKVYQTGAGPISKEVESIHVRPMRLEKTTTPYIVEGILRGMPWEGLGKWMLEIGKRRGPDEQVLATWLDLCADRGSQNYPSAGTVFGMAAVSKKVIPHIGFCGCHGLVLARNRPKQSKSLNTGMSSFRKWMRPAKNSELFEKGLESVVADSPVEWIQAARPREEIDAATAFRDNLFQDKTVLKTERKLPNGATEVVPSKLSHRLDRVLSCRRWCVYDQRFVHWCERVVVVDGLGAFVERWCCETEAEARGKVLDILKEWAIGLAWGEGADNRWTLQPICQRRYLVTELLDFAFSRGLRECLKILDLEGLGVVAALERILNIDRDNWPARNKLRLLNVAKAFATVLEHGLLPHIRCAVLVTLGSILDDILYAYLGRKGVRPRATLATMINPESSPVLRGQASFVNMLTRFDATNERWAVANGVGIDFNHRQTRQFVRQQALGYGAGLVQYFELFWSLDPYRTALVGLDSTLPEDKLRLSVAFYDQDVRCLSLGSQRIREILPSVPDMLRFADLLYKPFLEDSVLATDYCERANAKVRSMGERTRGAGSNFTATSNHCFAHAVNSEHVGLGGVDPASRASITRGPTAELIRAVIAGDQKRSGVGSNVRMEHHNLRLSVLSEMNQKIGTMSDTPERADVLRSPEELEQQIAEEWAVILATGQYEVWHSYFESLRRKRRVREPATSEEGATAVVEFNGLWSCSRNNKHVIPPAEFAKQSEAFSSMPAESRAHLIVDDLDLEVRSPVPQYDEEPTVVPRERLQGCGAAFKNVCREHLLTRVKVLALDRVTSLMCKFVAYIGKDRTQSVDEILCFVGASDDDDDMMRVTSVYLLVDARYSPKVQYFVRVCWPLDKGLCVLDQVEFPMDACLEIGPPRMERLHTTLSSIVFMTSDEVALELISLNPRWEICTMEFEWCDGPDLTLLVLTGWGPKFEPPPQARERRDNRVGAELLNNDDPWAAMDTDQPHIDPTELENPHLAEVSSDSVLAGLEDNALAASDVDLGGIGDEHEHDGSPEDDVPDCGSDDVGCLGAGGSEDELLVDATALQGLLDPPAPPKPPLPPPPEVPVPPVVPDPPPPVVHADIVERARPEAPARPGERQVIIDGQQFTELYRGPNFDGYSIRCPTCTISKNLNYMKSGMDHDTARRRLITWSQRCRADHRAYGGRLLKDCVV